MYPTARSQATGRELVPVHFLGEFHCTQNLGCSWQEHKERKIDIDMMLQPQRISRTIPTCPPEEKTLRRDRLVNWGAPGRIRLQRDPKALGEEAIRGP